MEGDDKHFIEAAALLSHIQMMESRLGSMQHLGHPPPPRIIMCPMPNRPSGFPNSNTKVVFATLVYTQRCASAQLLKESADFSSVGAPVEVLSLSGDEQIVCARAVPLESDYLSAEDTLIVPDRSTSMEEDDDHVVSLMTGGVVPVAVSARVCMIFGTSAGRVLSVEFSVNVRTMHLVRRDNTLGDEMLPYFEPLPHSKLTTRQNQDYTPAPASKASKTSRAPVQGGLGRPAGAAKVVPFGPKGGVTAITLQSVASPGDKRPTTFIWMSFSDGQTMRLHHAGFFPSVVQMHDDASKQSDPTSLEQRLSQGEDAILKLQLCAPDLEASSVTVIPMSVAYPSPLAPLSGDIMDAIMGDGSIEEDESKANTEDPTYEAIAFSPDYMLDTFPTIAYFTSEDQCHGQIISDPLDSVAAPEANVIGSMFGGAVSLLGGVVGGLVSAATATVVKPKRASQIEVVDAAPEGALQECHWDPRIPFPSMNTRPTFLYCGYETHDYPRRITSCTVDPDGKLAAFTDTLGRVSLVDLATKQVIRMWKGYRETVCEWIEIPQNIVGEPWRAPKLTYLVMHSKQRRVVEVWRTRHGSKVHSIQVGRDAQLVPCRETSPVGYVSACYLAHSNIAFSSMNQLEKIVFEESNTPREGVTTRASYEVQKRQPEHSHDDAVRLQRLQQLLGNTNIVCQSIDVYKAFQNIDSVKDLSIALDLIAVAPVLEERMGVEGSTFQRLALSHCRQKLDDAVRKANGEAITNPFVMILAFKLTYFSQIIKSFDLLHKFELDPPAPVKAKDIAPQSDWAVEAVGWTSTYDKIHKETDSKDQTQEAVLMQVTKFFVFANACVAPRNSQTDQCPGPQPGYKIFFSDSSKTRKDVLIHIFRPLLGDVFSFGVVDDMFAALGLTAELDYLQKCFGEWFLSLSVQEATEHALFITESPMSRWLQVMVEKQIANKSYNDSGILMHALFTFCRKSEDLVRAFYLATLCRDSVLKVTKKKEEETYGKISSDEFVESWEMLLRKLRMCLLITLRLKGKRLGVEPLTVYSAERPGNFSVLEWLAMDELDISHNQDEILSLERACRISSHAFNPCSRYGDDPARWKAIQKSCVAASISEAERAEYLVDFDDAERLCPLLLYLKTYNRQEWVAAHRALQLASEWGRSPNNLDTLEAAVAALGSIPMNHNFKVLACAIRLELWQNRFRPVLRALLFGFDDVQEISSAAVAPLIERREWLIRFGKEANRFLDALSGVEWEYGEEPDDFKSLPIITDDDGGSSMNNNENNTHSSGGGGGSPPSSPNRENSNASSPYAEEGKEQADAPEKRASVWPPIQEDHVLERLVRKSRKLDSTAVDAHRSLICAVLVSSDTSMLVDCVPAFYDLFGSQAIFKNMTPLEDADDKRHAFMQDATVAYAKRYKGPALDVLELNEIETLADLWEFDMVNVRTLFLLAMYEFGKDRSVDELLTKCADTISVHHFCENGVDIVCRRLHDILHVRQPTEVQNVMSMLDANVCEQIRERAESSEPLVVGKLNVPVQDTHVFALRLLSLAAVAEISKEDRIQIHSLIVLSGSLVKAVEEAMSAE